MLKQDVKQRLEDILLTPLHRAAHNRQLLPVCFALAFIGSLTAIIPGSMVMLSAALLNAKRWLGIALSGSLGSSLGAIMLVLLAQLWGWELLYNYFPEASNNPEWQNVIRWAQADGLIGLFLVCLSPLPQTPALILISSAHLSLSSTASVIYAGKSIKYGAMTLLASRFPQLFKSLTPRLGRRLPKA